MAGLEDRGYPERRIACFGRRSIFFLFHRGSIYQYWVAVAVIFWWKMEKMREGRRWACAREMVRDLVERSATLAGMLTAVADAVVEDAMVAEMHEGLERDGRSKLKMLISNVDNLPNGSASIGTSSWISASYKCISYLLTPPAIGLRRHSPQHRSVLVEALASINHTL